MSGAGAPCRTGGDGGEALTDGGLEARLAIGSCCCCWWIGGGAGAIAFIFVCPGVV